MTTDSVGPKIEPEVQSHTCPPILTTLPTHNFLMKTNRHYLIGSPHELGTDIYLETHQTWMDAGNGIAVYAQIDYPTEETLTHVGKKVATSWHDPMNQYVQVPPTPQIGEALKLYINWEEGG